MIQTYSHANYTDFPEEVQRAFDCIIAELFMRRISGICAMQWRVAEQVEPDQCDWHYDTARNILNAYLVNEEGVKVDQTIYIGY